MIIKILGNKDSQAYKIAEACVREKGHRVWNESTGAYDLAIAPLLTEKVSVEVLKEPLYGTLIFHPSPLPYGRGASSIKWAYKRQEPITAATWFWADNGLDTGDICEQEIVKIDYSAARVIFTSVIFYPLWKGRWYVAWTIFKWDIYEKYRRWKAIQAMTSGYKYS